MFSAEVIAFFFVSMFVAVFVYQFLDKKNLSAAANVVGAFGCVASLYCVLAGLYLAFDWQDPFANTSAQQLGQASASHGGRGGLVVLAIRFWPFVLIGLGGYMAYNGILLLWYSLRKR